MHGHPKLFQHWLFAHIFSPSIYHGKFVAPLEHQFHFFHIPLLAVLQISDSHASFLHLSSFTFWFIVCLLCISSLLFSGQVFTASSHSHHVSSSLKCLDPLYTSHPRFETPFPSLWRCYTSWIPPKVPLKVCQNEHCMTCHPLLLPLPSPSFFNLLFMAWTCRTHALHSWFTWLLFQEGENRHKFLCQPFKAWEYWRHKPPKGLAQKSPYINSNPATTHAHHPSQHVSQSQTQAKFINPHSLSKEDQQMMFQAKTSPKRHLQAL